MVQCLECLQLTVTSNLTADDGTTSGGPVVRAAASRTGEVTGGGRLAVCVTAVVMRPKSSKAVSVVQSGRLRRGGRSWGGGGSVFLSLYFGQIFVGLLEESTTGLQLRLHI